MTVEMILTHTSKRKFIFATYWLAARTGSLTSKQKKNIRWQTTETVNILYQTSIELSLQNSLTPYRSFQIRLEKESGT